MNAFGSYVWSNLVPPIGSAEVLVRQLRCLRDRNCRSIQDPAVYENDLDGDGVANIDELASGINPSRTDNGDVCGATYGCGARVEPRGTLDTGAAAATGLALLGVWAATRRARRLRRR
jgi:hypothetical protein